MQQWKRNLWILFACQFLVLSAMTMILPFMPLYLQELGMTDMDKVSLWSGLIFGASFFTAFLFSPFWGRLADKYGRKVMILRSGFGMSVTIILLGFATGPVQLLLLRLLNGVVSGFIPASIGLVATNTPKEHTGYALGTLQSGAVAGSIIGPLFGGAMAEAFGFRMIFNITGICVLVAATVVLLFVKEIEKPTGDVPKSNALKDFKRVTVHKPMIALFFAAFLIQLAMLGVNPMIPLFVQELASGENIAFLAGAATAVMGFANMMASPQLGKLADRTNRQKVLFFSLSGAAIASIPVAFVSDLWQLFVLRFMIGLFAGGLLPTVNSIIKQLSPQGMESRTYGFSNSFVYLGNMLGPILAGWLSAGIGIRGVFVFSAIIFFVNIVLVKFYIMPIMEGRQPNVGGRFVKSS
ncbi:MFS transporter [Bacillus tianshenii]|nr:MFS transporter [Bacillus tianshenii]